MKDYLSHKKSTVKSSEIHFKFVGVPLSTFDYGRAVLGDKLYVPV